jgi:hypothetical protein
MIVKVNLLSIDSLNDFTTFGAFPGVHGSFLFSGGSRPQNRPPGNSF